MSNSLRPHGLQPTRLLHPWDFPGKGTGVDCRFLLQGIFTTQGLPGLSQCRQMLLPSEPLGKPPELTRWLSIESWKFLGDDVSNTLVCSGHKTTKLAAVAAVTCDWTTSQAKKRYSTKMYCCLRPDSSVGKESTCNAGDPSWIPGSGRTPGKGIGYPLQYSWVGFPRGSADKESSYNEGDLSSIPELGRSPGEGKPTHSSILAWRIPWTVYSMGWQRVRHDWVAFTFTVPGNI